MSADDTADAAGIDDDITLVHVPERNRYEVHEGDTVLGFTAYELPDDEHVDFTHTEIGEEYGGRGLAGRVVAYALADVRLRGLRVVPHCPFVQSWLKKHPGYSDAVDWP